MFKSSCYNNKLYVIFLLRRVTHYYSNCPHRPNHCRHRRRHHHHHSNHLGTWMPTLRLTRHVHHCTILGGSDGICVYVFVVSCVFVCVFWRVLTYTHEFTAPICPWRDLMTSPRCISYTRIVPWRSGTYMNVLEDPAGCVIARRGLIIPRPRLPRRAWFELNEGPKFTNVLV